MIIKFAVFRLEPDGAHAEDAPLMEIPLERWIPFFSLVGGAAATLAGLLFVALSINRDKLSAGESKIMLRLAQRCFADYLFVLVICVFLLI